MNAAGVYDKVNCHTFLFFSCPSTFQLQIVEYEQTHPGIAARAILGLLFLLPGGKTRRSEITGIHVGFEDASTKMLHRTEAREGEQRTTYPRVNLPAHAQGSESDGH